MLLDLVLFCCFLCVFLIRERFVLPKFVFCHEFGLYCFCCALSRSCRYHSKFRRFKPICFLVLFVLVVEMHHSILFFRSSLCFCVLVLFPFIFGCTLAASDDISTSPYLQEGTFWLGLLVRMWEDVRERDFNYILPWVMFFLLFSLNVCYGIFHFRKRTEDSCHRMNFLPDVSIGRPRSENSGIGRPRQTSSLTALYDRDVVVRPVSAQNTGRERSHLQADEQEVSNSQDAALRRTLSQMTQEMEDHSRTLKTVKGLPKLNTLCDDVEKLLFFQSDFYWKMRNNVEDRSLWHHYLFEAISGDLKLSLQRMDYSTMGVSNIITFLFQDNLGAEW